MSAMAVKMCYLALPPMLQSLGGEVLPLDHTMWDLLSPRLTALDVSAMALQAHEEPFHKLPTSLTSLAIRFAFSSVKKGKLLDKLPRQLLELRIEGLVSISPEAQQSLPPLLTKLSLPKLLLPEECAFPPSLRSLTVASGSPSLFKSTALPRNLETFECRLSLSDETRAWNMLLLDLT
jgi:hypothetical protein